MKLVSEGALNDMFQQPDEPVTMTVDDASALFSSVP